jgi:hypothetical protein
MDEERPVKMPAPAGGDASDIAVFSYLFVEFSAFAAAMSSTLSSRK